jgi:hypothetical protein
MLDHASWCFVKKNKNFIFDFEQKISVDCFNDDVFHHLLFHIAQLVLCAMLPLWPSFPLLHLVLVLLGRFLGFLVVRKLFRRLWLNILLV